MMTYEQIQAANAGISTTDVKGKSYAEVNQRIMAFRSICPNGSILTEIVSLNDGVCVIKATVLDDEQNVLGTGHAYEVEASTYINKTSYIENCETSAVGRALGMCGLGIAASVASFEEVQNAVAQQEQFKCISCGKTVEATTANKSIKKYGHVFCSGECKAKFDERLEEVKAKMKENEANKS